MLYIAKKSVSSSAPTPPRGFVSPPVINYSIDGISQTYDLYCQQNITFLLS